MLGITEKDRALVRVAVHTVPDGYCHISYCCRNGKDQRICQTASFNEGSFLRPLPHLNPPSSVCVSRFNDKAAAADWSAMESCFDSWKGCRPVMGPSHRSRIQGTASLGVKWLGCEAIPNDPYLEPRLAVRLGVTRLHQNSWRGL